MDASAFLLIVVILGCVFAYTNGFQDGSSVSASPIAARAMSKHHAVYLTAAFEYLGALFGGSKVAASISGITDFPRGVAFLSVVCVALLSAICWNFVTRVLKVPSSSTHALVGGLIGSIYGASGSFKYVIFGDFGYLIHPTGVAKVIVTLFLSPLIGFGAGYICLRLAMIVFAKASSRLSVALKRMQWLVLPILAFGHGANDTQKVMGLIVMCLAGSIPAPGDMVIPLWVRLLVGLAMTSGVVAMTPGIVKRVGSGIYPQRPVHGFVSELASAIVVTFGSLTGGPVSASQVIASTVMGVGYAERRKGVHWLVAKDMLVAWFLTIPCSGLLAFSVYTLVTQFSGRLQGL